MRHRVYVVVMTLLAGWLSGCMGTTFARTLVEYRRTGGFAGSEDRLIIDVNGEATLTRKAARHEFVLDRDTMDQLLTLFDDAGFSTLHKEYLPPRQGSDLFEYVIAYKGHRVRTMDTAVPESLQPILELLNRIIESRGKP